MAFVKADAKGNVAYLKLKSHIWAIEHASPQFSPFCRFYIRNYADPKVGIKTEVLTKQTVFSTGLNLSMTLFNTRWRGEKTPKALTDAEIERKKEQLFENIE